MQRLPLLPQLAGEHPAAHHAPFLLIEGHQPQGPDGRLAQPAAPQLQQGSHAAGVIVGARGSQGPVVMGSHQDRIEIQPLARQLQDQVYTSIAALLEVVLLHRAQGLQALQQHAAHRQQTEFIPAGMARSGDGLQVGEQPLLKIGIEGLGMGYQFSSVFTHRFGSHLGASRFALPERLDEIPMRISTILGLAETLR